MATDTQLSQFLLKLKEYKKRYLKKKYAELDESATRLMVNFLLSSVLGYTELEEIKTEYRIRGEYADYIIQLNRKKKFVVEVKAIQIDLNDKHLRQSVGYAANEGIDWIILTNGRQIQLYKVIFAKPIGYKLVFGLNLDDSKELKSYSEYMYYLTKRSVLKGELDAFWKRFQALEPEKFMKYFYTQDAIKLFRKLLKKDVNLIFSDDDIIDSLSKLVLNKQKTASTKIQKQLA